MSNVLLLGQGEKVIDAGQENIQRGKSRTTLC